MRQFEVGLYRQAESRLEWLYDVIAKGGVGARRLFDAYSYEDIDQNTAPGLEGFRRYYAEE